MATGGTDDAQRWQIAISLVAAWREFSDQRRAEAVAERLAAVAVKGGPAAVEQAALGLTDVAGMFMELYADCAGRSLDSILADAAAVKEPDGPSG
jgi:hypothetical protein